MKIVDWIISKRECDQRAVTVDNESLTYRQLYQYSMGMAYIIMKVAAKEKNIGVYAENAINYLIGYFAVLLSGKCIVPIKNDTLNCNIQKVLLQAQVKTVLTDGKNYIAQRNIQIERNCVESEFLIQNDDDILLLETTGTTEKSGKTKLVRLNDNNLIFVVNAYINELKLGEKYKEKFWILVPLQSAYGNFVFLSCICSGVEIYINTDWRPWDFKRIIANNKVTHIECISTFLIGLVKINRDTDWESLRYIGFGGESISEDEINSLVRHFKNIEISQGYGLTEAGPLITIFPPRLVIDNPMEFHSKCRSVGRVLQGITIKISEDGKEEVLVKGPNVTSGYFGEKTKDIFVDGYLSTGDIGFVDKDGYLYIKGRKKNIAIVEGKNVQLEEVEHVMRLYPAIKDVHVYAQKDQYQGEMLIADIVGNEIDEWDLNHYLVSRLETYKIPTQIRNVSQIAKKGGKIIRK